MTNRHWPNEFELFPDRCALGRQPDWVWRSHTTPARWPDLSSRLDADRPGPHRRHRRQRITAGHNGILGLFTSGAGPKPRDRSAPGIPTSTSSGGYFQPDRTLECTQRRARRVAGYEARRGGPSLSSGTSRRTTGTVGFSARASICRSAFDSQQELASLSNWALAVVVACRGSRANNSTPRGANDPICGTATIETICKRWTAAAESSSAGPRRSTSLRGRDAARSYKGIADGEGVRHRHRAHRRRRHHPRLGQ